MAFHLHNMMTCSGFGTSMFGGCSMAWAGLVVLFFVAAILRKWVGEEGGVPFNFLLSLAGGLFVYVTVISIFGAMNYALAAGLVGVVLAGFVGPKFIDGGTE